ncbi:MAG: heme exporter protein CcmD [Pseudomonadales bacterium]
MYFDSFAAFVHMDGHGFYVWLAYAVALIVVLGLLLVPGMQKKRFIRDYKQSLRRQQQQTAAQHGLEASP